MTYVWVQGPRIFGKDLHFVLGYMEILRFLILCSVLSKNGVCQFISVRKINLRGSRFPFLGNISFYLFLFIFRANKKCNINIIIIQHFLHDRLKFGVWCDCYGFSILTWIIKLEESRKGPEFEWFTAGYDGYLLDVRQLLSYHFFI